MQSRADCGKSNPSPMKNLMLWGCLVLTLGMFAQEKIGEERNGRLVITANLNLLKAKWNEVTGETVSEYTLTSNRTETGVRYYLIGSTPSGTRIGTSVFYRSGSFFVPEPVKGVFSFTICQGCKTGGCEPQPVSDSSSICADPCNDCQRKIVAHPLLAWSD